MRCTVNDLVRLKAYFKKTNADLFPLKPQHSVSLVSISFAMTDRCYKLFDSLAKFTKEQSIQNCCKRNGDRSTSPLLSQQTVSKRRKVCLLWTNTSHSRLHTRTRLGAFTGLDTSHSLIHKHLQTHAGRSWRKHMHPNMPRRKLQ